MGDTVAVVDRYASSEMVLVLPLSLAVGAFPWRVKGASVSDCACHACLLATLLLAAFFAKDRHLTEVANLCFILNSDAQSLTYRARRGWDQGTAEVERERVPIF